MITRSYNKRINNSIQFSPKINCIIKLNTLAVPYDNNKNNSQSPLTVLKLIQKQKLNFF